MSPLTGRRSATIFAVASLALSACTENTPTQIEPFNVRGSVVGVLGTPAGGFTVSIEGRAPVITDDNGIFEYSDVVPPYDLLVLQSDRLGFHQVHAYEGLTVPNPEIVCCGGEPISVYNGPTLRGTVPIGPGETARLFFVDEYGQQQGFQPFTTSTYLVKLHFLQAPAVSGTVYLLKSLEASSEYVAIGHKPLEAHAGANQELSFSESDLMMVGQRVISGVSHLPIAFHITSYRLGPQWRGDTIHFEYVFAEGKALPAKFGYAFPDVPGATFSLGVYAVGPNLTRTSQELIGIEADGSSIELVMERPVTLISPADKQDGVKPGAAMTWSRGHGRGLYRVSVSNTPGPRFYIHTGKTSARIPDLTPFDIAPPVGQYAWSVAQILDVGSVDEFASRKAARVPHATTGSERRFFMLSDAP
jgi:hypothetical protein